nr:Chain E, 12-mer peptide [synthetic construct]5V1D_F Chain F, 12-mer peptide [synthetic construct]5V1D_G Chain G, 12-mer peptide [synthetic construct]
ADPQPWRFYAPR